MVGLPPFADAPADTREAIMAATYRALSTHGYADLTIQRIGAEFDKSKSLLYHHYDGKDDLLLDFLEFMLQRFETAIPFEDHEDASDHFEAMLDQILLSPKGEEPEEFLRAVIELRAQAAHDAAYREHFTRSDRFFRDRLAALIRAGVEDEVFRAVDPDQAAVFIQTVVVGAMLRRATSDGFAGQPIRDEIDRYLRSELLLDGALD